jgi:error-prone DNA polymerase
MLCHADSVAVFQVESRAQMSMLPRLQPRKFYDLVIEVAIVRPGPDPGRHGPPLPPAAGGQGTGRVPGALARRSGLANELRDVLGKTFGVPLFQEQAMRWRSKAAKFSTTTPTACAGSMATFRANGKLWEYREMFIEGMARRGYERDFAERLLQADRGLRLLRIPGEPRDQLRPPGLRLCRG